MTDLVLIAAMDLNQLIGRGEELPWHLPADLRHFRRQTTGKTILMGRKTFESIGKPLPNRRNVVLTRQTDFEVEGLEVHQSFESVFQSVSDESELMVIGGSHVYRTLLPLANRMILTVIHAEFTGDVFFPEFETDQWSVISRQDHAADEENLWSYSFLELVRTGEGTPISSDFPRGLSTVRHADDR